MHYDHGPCSELEQAVIEHLETSYPHISPSGLWVSMITITQEPNAAIYTYGDLQRREVRAEHLAQAAIADIFSDD